MYLYRIVVTVCVLVLTTSVSSQPLPCSDNFAECNDWASQGHCLDSRYIILMQQDCKLACDYCDTTPTTTQTTSATSTATTGDPCLKCPCRLVQIGSRSLGWQKFSCFPYDQYGKCPESREMFDCRDGYTTPTSTLTSTQTTTPITTTTTETSVTKTSTSTFSSSTISSSTSSFSTSTITDQTCRDCPCIYLPTGSCLPYINGTFDCLRIKFMSYNPECQGFRSSVSTTWTSTATSSLSTTATSTVSTTVSSSVTSTVSTSASITMSSSATSTLSNSISTTATSTMSTSLSTSVTSTQSSSISTTATTSVSSTVTTSVTSTATSTATSTMSITQSSTNSLSASSTQTATVTSTQTSTGSTHVPCLRSTCFPGTKGPCMDPLSGICGPYEDDTRPIGLRCPPVFQEWCELATTTATSSGTSTRTSTATSTHTSTATTTETTTATSTNSNTDTSSITSTVVSTVTSTLESTGTSSVSSTPTTSATSSQTTSVTTTVTSTNPSTATSTHSSTETETQTTTGTSTPTTTTTTVTSSSNTDTTTSSITTVTVTSATRTTTITDTTSSSTTSSHITTTPTTTPTTACSRLFTFDSLCFDEGTFVFVTEKFPDVVTQQAISSLLTRIVNGAKPADNSNAVPNIVHLEDALTANEDNAVNSIEVVISRIAKDTRCLSGTALFSGPSTEDYDVCEYVNGAEVFLLALPQALSIVTSVIRVGDDYARVESVAHEGLTTSQLVQEQTQITEDTTPLNRVSSTGGDDDLMDTPVIVAVVVLLILILGLCLFVFYRKQEKKEEKTIIVSEDPLESQIPPPAPTATAQHHSTLELDHLQFSKPAEWIQLTSYQPRQSEINDEDMIAPIVSLTGSPFRPSSGYYLDIAQESNVDDMPIARLPGMADTQDPLAYHGVEEDIDWDAFTANLKNAATKQKAIESTMEKKLTPVSTKVKKKGKVKATAPKHLRSIEETTKTANSNQEPAKDMSNDAELPPPPPSRPNRPKQELPPYSESGPPEDAGAFRPEPEKKGGKSQKKKNKDTSSQRSEAEKPAAKPRPMSTDYVDISPASPMDAAERCTYVSPRGACKGRQVPGGGPYCAVHTCPTCSNSKTSREKACTSCLAKMDN
eukprot:m.82400 g.82400  ORF g.82400 m.82400 type:complete len:1113 (-) comp12870_c0_seq1:2199-5537(-)